MIFSEHANVAGSIYGQWQAPLRLFLESREQAYEKQSCLNHIFGKQESKHFAETYGGLTGFEDFQPVGENGAYPQQEAQMGDEKILRNETWKSSFSVSREMVDDDMIGVFRKRPEGFMKAYYATREKHGAGLLAAAMQGKSYVTMGGKNFSTACADKLNLFHTEHPAKIKGAKQSNLFSNPLNAENLGRAESAMQNFKDENGNLLGIEPKTIVIPNNPDLKKAAFEAVGSMDDPATSDNAFNYQYGRWNIIVWSYLDLFLAAGLTPWMLLDEEYSEMVGTLIWQERVELEVTSTIAENDANVWKGYARFAAGFGDWRGVCCGGIDGGTTL